MNDGIPLIWVPRSSVVSELMHAESAGAREEILAEARQEIVDDCLVALAEISDPDLLPLHELAAAASWALRDGHCSPDAGACGICRRHVAAGRGGTRCPVRTGSGPERLVREGAQPDRPGFR